MDVWNGADAHAFEATCQDEAGGCLDVRLRPRMHEAGGVLQLQDSFQGTGGGLEGLGAETPEIREPGKLRR